MVKFTDKFFEILSFVIVLSVYSFYSIKSFLKDNWKTLVTSLIWIILGIAGLYLLMGCKEDSRPVKEPVKEIIIETPAPIEQPPQQYVYIADWDHLPEGKAYSEFTLKAIDELGNSLLELKSIGDSVKWCPKFKELSIEQKKQFYLMLISSMVRFESNFKPSTEYKENFKDAKGKYVVSRGLLQISIESSKGYACMFKDEKELHDPELNLRCGVRILNKWIVKDGLIGSNDGGHRGGGRYWSVLRENSGSYKKIVNNIQKLEFCR